MLTQLEIVIIASTTSQEEALAKALKFLPAGEHVEASLDAVSFEDGVILCLLRSTERSGLIIAKKILESLWRLSFVCTDEEVPLSQIIPGVYDIRAINRGVIEGLNTEKHFD